MPARTTPRIGAQKAAPDQQETDVNPTAAQEQPLPPRRNEALQAGLDLIDQGFTLIDENLQLIAWNKAFLDLLGFPAEMGHEGAPFESFMRYNAERGEYGEGDREEYVTERVDAAKAFSTHDIERTRPNGTVLRIRGVPVPGHGFVTLYSDVTEQRRAERLIMEQNAHLESRVAERTAELTAANEQLREALRLNNQFAHSLQRSEGQMRLITDSIPALVAYFDASLSYGYINRGYQEWFGLDPAHPEHASARQFLGADTYSRIKPHIKKALQGESVTFEYEVATQRGIQRLARTSLIPEVSGHGQVVGCFELTFDITEQRRAHDMLVQAQKMEALGQLTGGMSHDFNNILTVILGNLSALAEQADIQHHVSEYIQPAIDAAKRGSDLIRGLLSFSRQQTMEITHVEVGSLIAEVDKLVRHTLPETLRLQLSLDASPVPCKLDAHQFQNALLNLILNAKDATESRGHISIHCAARSVNAALAENINLSAGEYACISVRDDGCGMDSATRTRVFEPFFTTKPPGRGSGLGMSMVYGFARQSGGSVDVCSEPGKGTQVTLWLPTEAQATPPALPAHAPALASPQRFDGLALLVEDDASVRKIVRRQLLDIGYSVVEAENGTEAVELLNQTQGIRLVLTDVVMPGALNGFQVASYAMRKGHIPNVVLMSGYVPDAEAIEGVPLLKKPFTREQLVLTLQGKTP
jgi:signal transduction histidine kinase